MTKTLLKCQICLGSQPILDFKVFPCGHGFCASCVGEIFKHNPVCPQCRARLYQRDAHHLYLELSSPEEERATTIETLVNGLNQMGQDSQVISVETALKKLERFVGGLEDTPNTVDALLRAVEDFQERIIPVFKRAKEQAREIENLKQSLQTCQGDWAESVRRIEPLEKELSTMRSTVIQMEREREQAIGLARLASDETVKLRGDLAHSKTLVSELEEKTRRYKGQLITHTRTAQQKADKIESLEQELANLRARHIDKDETSLEVVLESEYSTAQNFRTIDPATPLKSPCSLQRPLLTRKNDVRGDFEAMPPPGGFRSDWQISIPDKLLKKRKVGPENEPKGNFPLSLDKKGRVIGTVQLGMRRTLRAPLR